MAKKKKMIMFKTLKPSGVHIITLVKGGMKYFMPNIPHPFETKLYQVSFEAGSATPIDEAEEIVEVNDLTKMGTLVKTVDLLREKIENGGSGIEEVTAEDLRKSAMAAIDSKVLADTLSSFLKDKDELEAVKTKDKLYEYVLSLGSLGYDVSHILGQDRATTTRAILISSILELTGKAEVAPTVADEVEQK